MESRNIYIPYLFDQMLHIAAISFSLLIFVEPLFEGSVYFADSF